MASRVHAMAGMRFTEMLEKIDPLALASVTGGAHTSAWWRDLASNQGENYDLLVRDLGVVRARRLLKSK